MQILLGISSGVDFLMVHITKFVLIGQEVTKQFFKQTSTQLMIPLILLSRWAMGIFLFGVAYWMGFVVEVVGGLDG